MGRKRKYKAPPPGADGEEGEQHEREDKDDIDAPTVFILRLGKLVLLSAGSDFSVFDPEDPKEVKFCSRGHGDAHTDSIRGLAASGDAKVLVTGGDDKMVKAWDTESWSVTRTSTMAKKVTSVIASKEGTMVAGADKFGDVYALDLTAGKDAAAEHCLGHMSIITNMVMAPSDDLVVTADRDSTIRTSCFPDGFNIEAFCLGHATHITQLLIPKTEPELLFSSDGNAEIILWKFRTGELLHRLRLSEESLGILAISFCAISKLLAVSLSNKTLVFLHLNQDGSSFERVSECSSAHLVSAIDFDEKGLLWAVTCAVDAEQKPTPYLTVLCSSGSDLNFLPVQESHPAHQMVSLVNARAVSCVESGVRLAGVYKKTAPKRFKDNVEDPKEV